jgi:4-hydroxy-tetrahydrodipicolinate synthase
MSISWKGVYPAVTTKFTADDELDIKATALGLKAQLDAGVHGIVLGGTLGEASTLTVKEKEKLMEISLDTAAQKVPVLMNIAEQSTADAIKAAHKAEDFGVHGLMMLPPMRYFSDHRETVQYFSDVASSTGLPIMIYNNPVDYKIEVTIDMFEELKKFNNIQAVKESTRDTTNITLMRNAFGDRYKILCGVDTLALESLLLGADGWVAGLVCAFPMETVAIYNLVQQGKVADALAIYKWFMPLLELDIHPKLVQNIKLAESLTGLGTEHVRKPRLPLVGEERERVLQIIENGIETRPTLPVSQPETITSN